MCVCVCVLCVSVYVYFVLFGGLFCTKRKPMGLCPGGRGWTFILILMYFNGNLVNFSLYFFNI